MCIGKIGNNSRASKACNNSLRCSARMPDRPAALPHRASRSALATARVESCTGWAPHWVGKRCPRGSIARRELSRRKDSPGPRKFALADFRASPQMPSFGENFRLALPALPLGVRWNVPRQAADAIHRAGMLTHVRARGSAAHAAARASEAAESPNNVHPGGIPEAPLTACPPLAAAIRCHRRRGLGST